MRLPLTLLAAATTQVFNSFINLGGGITSATPAKATVARFVFPRLRGSAASFEDVAPLLAAKMCAVLAWTTSSPARRRAPALAASLQRRQSSRAAPRSPRRSKEAAAHSWLAGGLLPEARGEPIASGLRGPRRWHRLPWTLAGFRGDPTRARSSS